MSSQDSEDCMVSHTQWVPLLPHKPKCPSLGSVRALPSESTRQSVYHTVGKSAQVCVCTYTRLCVRGCACLCACACVQVCVDVCVFIPNTTVKLLYTGHKIPFLEQGGD